MKRQRRRNFNPANWLVGLGVVALGLSFWLPHATASRTARIESRAGDIAANLLREAVAVQPFDPGDALQVAHVEARTLQALAARGIRLDSFVEGPTRMLPGGEAVLFRGRHFVFLLTRTPVSVWRAGTRQRAELCRPLEVYAYPRAGAPAQSAYFHGEIERAAFTRNLQADYKHGGRRPAAGAAVPRRSSDTARHYRGRDDERWLVTSDGRAAGPQK